MNFTKTVLPNKITLITVPIPTLESICVTVWVGVGSRFEEENYSGISHFIEHMAFKGSKKYQTARKVSETIDSMGADYNAGTSHEWTNFFIKSRKENLGKIFDVLSDMILNPLLDVNEIEKERGVILEEIAMEEDTPSDKIGTIFMELAFGKTPLGRDIAGTKSTVKSISKRNFESFRSTHYKGGNMVITVSGGKGIEEASNLAQKYFGEIESGAKETPKSFVLDQTTQQLKVEYKKSEQAHIILGFMGHERKHPARYAENVLVTILGRGMSSRLFHEVREKRGLAYSVGSSISRFNDTGVFDTYAGVDVKRADEAVKVILDEHYKLSNNINEITNEEIQKAKDYMKGRIALALEDTVAICDYFGQRALFMESIETPETIFAKIDAVTKDDVERSAKDLFDPSKLNLAVIGPFKKEEKFAKIIK